MENSKEDLKENPKENLKESKDPISHLTYNYNQDDEYSLWKDDVIFVAEPLVGGGKNAAYKLKKRKKLRKLPTHCRSCPFTSIWLYASLACFMFQSIISGFSIITNIVVTGTIAVMVLLCLIVVMYCTPLMHCHMKRYSLKSCLSIATLTAVIATMAISQHIHDFAAFYEGNTVALSDDNTGLELHDADFLTFRAGYISKSKAAVSTESNLVCVAPIFGLGNDHIVKVFAVNFLDDCCGKFDCPGWQDKNPGGKYSLETIPALTWDDIPEELTIEINEDSITAAVKNAAKMGGFKADKDLLYVLYTEDQNTLQTRNFKIALITLVATLSGWPLVVLLLYPFKLCCCPTKQRKMVHSGKQKGSKKKNLTEETQGLTQEQLDAAVDNDPPPIKT